jgi:SAM-dependent methyltransferase
MNRSRQARDYDSKFYRELDSAQKSAAAVLPIVFGVVKPQSMVDIGCGTGKWLAKAVELGVEDILGVDGTWVDRNQLAIPSQNFVTHDLTTPLSLERRFDLALSLEVAEHLPEAAAGVFVESICSASDVVLFSAAIPGQGGRRHVNEQWPAYWAELFHKLGYDCFDYLRPKIWNDAGVAWYYAQNSLVFVRRGRDHQFGERVTPLPLVHPGLWSAEIERMRHPGKLLERLIKTLTSNR